MDAYKKEKRGKQRQSKGEKKEKIRGRKKEKGIERQSNSKRSKSMVKENGQ